MEGQIIASRYTCADLFSQDSLGPRYHAQRSDGRQVILQVLPAQGPGEGVRRVEKEIQTVAGLRHPNLATPLELLPDQGVLYLVRDSVDGELLSARLARVGLPPAEPAFDLLERVTDALSAAHKKDLFHLRLRPDKIFLQRVKTGDVVRVLDLGLAPLTHEEPPETHLLRARYIAPEQVTRSQAQSARTDVYALGLLYFELLSGKPPYPGQDPQVLLQQHANDRAPTLTDCAPDRLFSAELEGLVASMLAKAPQNRPAHAGVVLERLRELRQSGDLIIVLDPREEEPGGEWRIASARDGEAVLESLADAKDQATEAELPVPRRPVMNSRPPAAFGGAALAGAEAAIAEATQRHPQPPQPGARRNPQGARNEAARPAEAARPKTPRPVAQPRPFTPLPPLVEQGHEPVRQVQVSAADALAPLLLPSNTGENEAIRRSETRPRRVVAWLRKTVRLGTRQVPRFALVGGGVVLLGMMALAVTSLTDPDPVAKARPIARGAAGKPGGTKPGQRPGQAKPGQKPGQATAQAPGQKPGQLPGQMPPVQRAGAQQTAALGTPPKRPAPGATPPSVPAPAVKLVALGSVPRAAALVGESKGEFKDEARPSRPGSKPPEQVALAPGLHREKPVERPARPPVDRPRVIHLTRVKQDRPEPAVKPSVPAEPNRVTVRIASSPAGAQVVRDGQVIGTTPFSEAMERKDQMLSYLLVRAGYTSVKVQVVPTRDRQLKYELLPILLLK